MLLPDDDDAGEGCSGLSIQRRIPAQARWTRRAGTTARPSLSRAIASGITDNVTPAVESRLHPGRLYQRGPSLNLRLPIGEIEAAASVSRTTSGSGAPPLSSASASAVVLSAPADPVRLASRQYATLTPKPEGEDPATEANVFASAPRRAGHRHDAAFVDEAASGNHALANRRCCRRSMSRATWS